ncbi:MAG: prolyl oligopeptidase family serine peptidase [Bryobacteraceae bacterium]
MTRYVLPLTILAAALPLTAQVKQLPPAGIEVPEADRKVLEAGVESLGKRIAALRGMLGPRIDLLPDVEIYHKAVDYALRYHEFLRTDDIARSKELLAEGEARAAALERGEAPWTRATGLVVRGYVSKIDGSVQPYGLLVPKSWAPDRPHRYRLDMWFHGRSEQLNEISFIYDSERRPGQFTPPDTFVLSLYGRYCNASKFAGEVDLFEALEAVKRHYPIDERRIVVRGFSMGGASTWHVAAHHAGLWAAASPGAGFAETAEYRRVFETGPIPPWYEQKLWHLYNATDYALNFYHCPTVAYSGELDRQKQAADIMARFLSEEGMRLTHIIGPKTEHRYHPDSKVEIDRLIDAIAARGGDPYPRKVRFTTWTLAYSRMKWVTLHGLGKHWERARIEAEIAGDIEVRVKTSNVTAFSLEMGAGGCPLDNTRKPTVVIDGKRIEAPVPMTDRSWTAHFRKADSGWLLVESQEDGQLRKRPGLQGPVDDAFLDRFVMVRPTGKPAAPGTVGWVASEQQRAIREWRRIFRGDAIVRDDSEIDDAEIARSHLVLWGDPGSNKVLARIADRLPVRWVGQELVLGDRRYPAGTHAPILIYPNPLNPKKYVVLNSGFTFRQHHHVTNSLQTPKLPDYAIVDTTTPADESAPGRIAAAGFFGEKWEPLPNDGQ